MVGKKKEISIYDCLGNRILVLNPKIQIHREFVILEFSPSKEFVKVSEGVGACFPVSWEDVTTRGFGPYLIKEVLGNVTLELEESKKATEKVSKKEIKKKPEKQLKK